MPRAALGLALLLAIVAHAQTLEVIQLKYRTADQVVDTLLPLLEPGGTITGRGNQLIVRTSLANLAELRRALDAVDQPPRRLQISVRFDEALESSRRDLEVGGAIGNRGARIEGRARDSQRNLSERVDYRVQALDGGRATILAGESRPVRQRQYIQTPAGVVSQEVTVVQETTGGFDVVPRVSGNMVTMDIYSARGGMAAASSSASGRLGEWFELGSLVMSGARDARSPGSLSRSSGGETRRIWVKVDALDAR